jgi:hypothetical protein
MANSDPKVRNGVAMRQHCVLDEAVPVALAQFLGRSRMPNGINTDTDEFDARDGSIFFG